MELLDFLKTMPPAEQESFAVDVGTTLPHLRNVAYKRRIASAALARQIEVRSKEQVPVSILRAHDWHLIWGTGINQLVNVGAIVGETGCSSGDAAPEQNGAGHAA